MSLALVAYGSSDESETSDAESNTEQQRSSVKLDVSDSRFETQTSGSANGAETGDGDQRKNIITLDGKLRELPEPKTHISIIDDSDELEEEVKPKPSQLADAPKPPEKKMKKPVQITVPALPDADDEKEPAKKKPKLGPATGKSGLTSLLPAPVHAARKESNRILLPYSLTKKVNPNPTPPQVKKPVSTVSNANTVNSLTTSLADYGSDSDENEGEAVNFFSLDSSPKAEDKDKTVSSKDKPVSSGNITSASLKPVEQTVSLPPTHSRTALNLPAPVKTVTQSPSSESENSAIVSESETTSQGNSLSNIYGPAVDPDAPLSFKGGVSHSYPTQNSSQDSGFENQQMMYSVEYAGLHSYPEADDEQALQQDEQFLRLQGKKMRGKEEINIVDINADDFTSPSEISKYISEEQTHQSHRKKDSNLPTHQQKRKHQIHYLAFEAKERELELKNQWSNNKMTRKQTQAKYGF